MRAARIVVLPIVSIGPPPARPEHCVSEREHDIRRDAAEADDHFLVDFTAAAVLLAVASMRCWRVDNRTLHVREGIGLLVES